MVEPVGVLGEIVARKRFDVRERFDGVSIDELRARAAPTTRSLKTALARPGARFVMEVKRGSPSQGKLRNKVNPAALGRAYSGAADAVSVLTDGPYFGGSFADLRAVRTQFEGPILAKDFMVDARQVVEARLHGADAILVMLSVLDDSEASALIAEARRLGMDALVEAHTEVEVRRAVALGAEIVGINNRDLRSLKVDLATTEHLAHLVPSDRVLISESGIESRTDVERLAGRVDAFLVGSSLVRSEKPHEAARALAFSRVKVCGLTDVEAIETAAEAGAAYGGLIMVPETPRAVELSKAEPLAVRAAEKQLPLVGVFRDETIARVADATAALQLHAVQLHGREDQDYIDTLRPLLPQGCEIWAAGPVEEEVRPVPPGADRTLFDTSINGRSGGTGRTFDWRRLEGRPDLVNGLLAGGLRPENARAASRVGAWGLDVSSGVESAPGRKDPAKIGAFFQALRPPRRNEP